MALGHTVLPALFCGAVTFCGAVPFPGTIQFCSAVAFAASDCLEAPCHLMGPCNFVALGHFLELCHFVTPHHFISHHQLLTLFYSVVLGHSVNFAKIKFYFVQFCISRNHKKPFRGHLMGQHEMVYSLIPTYSGRSSRIYNFFGLGQLLSEILIIFTH